MTYRDGKLTVPISGRYFIYAQIYYYNNNGRVYIRVNSKVVTLISPMKSSNSEGTLYTGGVFTLKAGDVITLTTASWPTSITKVWMGTFHCFMGAFLIWAHVMCIFGRRLNALFDFVPAEVKHRVIQRLPLELDASFLSNWRHLELGFISVMSWFKSQIKKSDAKLNPQFFVFAWKPFVPSKWKCTTPILFYMTKME